MKRGKGGSFNPDIPWTHGKTRTPPGEESNEQVARCAAEKWAAYGEYGGWLVGFTAEARGHIDMLKGESKIITFEEGCFLLRAIRTRSSLPFARTSSLICAWSAGGKGRWSGRHKRSSRSATALDSARACHKSIGCTITWIVCGSE